MKQRLVNVKVLLAESPDLAGAELEDIIRRCSEGVEIVSYRRMVSTPDGKGLIAKTLNIMTYFLSPNHRSASATDQRVRSKVQNLVKTTPDSSFLLELNALVPLTDEQPLLRQVIDKTVELADKHLQTFVKTLSQKLAASAVSVLQAALQVQFDFDRGQRRDEFRLQSLHDLIRDMTLENKAFDPS